MTEQHEDETLAWAREIASELGTAGNGDDDVLNAPETADPEAVVLAAMAQLPENWKRYVADVAQGIAEELAEQPGAVPSAGRHHASDAN